MTSEKRNNTKDNCLLKDYTIDVKSNTSSKRTQNITIFVPQELEVEQLEEFKQMSCNEVIKIIKRVYKGTVHVNLD